MDIYIYMLFIKIIYYYPINSFRSCIHFSGMRNGSFLFVVLWLGSFSFLEGSPSFTPTLEKKVFDSQDPSSFEWRERVVSLLNRGKRGARGEDTPYIFTSWLDGPPCPDYEWDTVSGEAVVATPVVKNALRGITANGLVFFFFFSISPLFFIWISFL